MFGLLFSIVVWLAEIFIGIGLVVNCTRGLFSGEGMYDKQSTDIMVGSQILGILLGVFLLAAASGLVRLPLPYFGNPFIGGR